MWCCVLRVVVQFSWTDGAAHHYMLCIEHIISQSATPSGSDVCGGSMRVKMAVACLSITAILWFSVSMSHGGKELLWTSANTDDANSGDSIFGQYWFQKILEWGRRSAFNYAPPDTVPFLRWTWTWTWIYSTTTTTVQIIMTLCSSTVVAAE